MLYWCGHREAVEGGTFSRCRNDAAVFRSRANPVSVRRKDAFSVKTLLRTAHGVGIVPRDSRTKPRQGCCKESTISSRHGTILLVEDDRDLRDAIETILHRAGYEVTATGTGHREVELANEHEPTVALVDLLLPSRSGSRVPLVLKERFGGRVRVMMSRNSCRVPGLCRRRRRRAVPGDTVHHLGTAGNSLLARPAARCAGGVASMR